VCSVGSRRRTSNRAMMHQPSKSGSRNRLTVRVQCSEHSAISESDACNRNKPNQASPARRSFLGTSMSVLCLGEIQSGEREEDGHPVQRHDGVFPRNDKK